MSYEARMDLVVRDDDTVSLRIRAPNGVDPQEFLEKAIEALVSERDRLPLCPIHQVISRRSGVRK